ncbi:hypothetical protein [Pseudooceanicola sp.]
MLSPLPARTEIAAFAWQGRLIYDPARVIAPGGATLGQLMAELFETSPQATEAVIRGRVEYDLSTPVTTQNPAVAAYRDAVTGMQAIFGGAPVIADIALIQANAGSSEVGMLTHPSGGFCSEKVHCEALGQKNPNWGNYAGALNNFDHFLMDETGTTTLTGDVIAILLGRTDAPGEFKPAIQTQSVGAVSLDGLDLLWFTAPDRQFVDDLSLPHVKVIDPEEVGRSEVWFFLEGEALPERLRIEGVVDEITVLR